MKKIITFFFSGSFLFIITLPAFALPREEIVKQNLILVEAAQSLQRAEVRDRQAIATMSQMPWSTEMKTELAALQNQRVEPAVNRPAAKKFSYREAAKSSLETTRQSRQPEKTAFSKEYPTLNSEYINPSVNEEGRGTFYISGGYNANHMDYKELDDSGTKLDANYGNLRGQYAEMGYRSNRPIEKLGSGKPYIEGYYRRYGAIIRYDGATQGGKPFMSDDKQDVQRFGIKLGMYQDFLDKGELYGYFDVGRRIWKRGENEIINGVTNYGEKYHWTYLGLGAGVNYRFFPKFTAGVDFEGIPLSVEPKMSVDDFGGGYKFNLGPVTGISVRIPLKYYILKSLSFDLTPYFDYWQIKESDSISVSANTVVLEPDSDTQIKGVLVGFTYSF